MSRSLLLALGALVEAVEALEALSGRALRARVGAAAAAATDCGWPSNPATRITAPAKPACWVGAVGRRGRLQVGSSGLQWTPVVAPVDHQHTTGGEWWGACRFVFRWRADPLRCAAGSRTSVDGRGGVAQVAWRFRGVRGARGSSRCCFWCPAALQGRLQQV